MTVISIASRLQDIEKFKFNPAAIQRANLLAVRQGLTREIDIVDPTNPFVKAMETTAVNTAAFCMADEALNRRQYAIAAVTDQDLYQHMSDKDYLNRFAMPSRATFTLLIMETELIRALVLDTVTGVSKLVIPRYAKFMLGTVVWTLEYPVEIRLGVHNGLSAVFDNSQPSPTSELVTNEVPLNFLEDPSGNLFVELKLPLQQFSINTVYGDVNPASGVVTTVDLTHQFYYARVYVQREDFSWRELQTTHTSQVFDPTVPTAVLKYLAVTGQLQVTIPSVYTGNGSVNGKLRIDVYETQGELNMLLENYNMPEFSADFTPIDTREKTPEVMAIRSIRTMSIYSSSRTLGGRSALSFEDLRDRVIKHSVGPQDEPITNVKLQSNLQDSGYEVVKDVDTLTNRIFLAAKAMPQPQDERLLTAAAASVQTAVFRMSSLIHSHGVNHHDFGVTLTPSVLYQSINGVTSLVSKADYDAFQTLTNVQRVQALQENTFLYSPFYYVLDRSSQNFQCRAYYLDSPKVLSKSFVTENASLGFQVASNTNYNIERIEGGYRLIVQTRSSRAFKALPDSQVFAQLSFLSQDQSVTAHMLGELQPRANATDERVYFFDMLTNFAMDASHSIDQESFQFSPTELTTRSLLEQNFSIIYATTAAPSSAQPSVIDNQLGRFQLPLDARGVSHERLRIRFGYHLNTLWTQARSVVSSIPYQRHTQDLQAFYQADQFDVDPGTGNYFELNGEGELVYRYKHRIGDPILDENGDITYAARAGEVMVDHLGAPLPEVGYEDELIRHVDITLIEGAYRFATDVVAKEYYNFLNASLVSWLTEDLGKISTQLLDETHIYFYPKVSQGHVRVLVADQQYERIEAGQAFTVTMTVPATTADNAELLQALQATAIRLIDQARASETVAISKIERTMLDAFGSDVIDVKLSGLGGDLNLQVVSLMDGAQRLSIRKRLVAQPDGQLVIEEDVTFDIVRHSVN